MYTDESNMYKGKYEASIIPNYTNKFNNEEFWGCSKNIKVSRLDIL